MDQSFDVRDMAEFIGKVIHGVATGGDMESWETMTEAEQHEFVELGAAAMRAHAAYFKDKGCRVLHPGVVQVPMSREEAQAMVASGTTWLAKNKPGIIRPSAIPRGPMQ